MVALCIVKIVETVALTNPTAQLVIQALASPSIFCVVESRLLFKMKEEFMFKSVSIGLNSIR